MPRFPSGGPDSCLQQTKIEFAMDVITISRGLSVVSKAHYERRILLATYAIAILSTSAMAETPYESAARVDMEQLASSILAASLCKGAQFPGMLLSPVLLLQWC
jgi:hypothetical protein